MATPGFICIDLRRSADSPLGEVQVPCLYRVHTLSPNLNSPSRRRALSCCGWRAAPVILALSPVDIHRALLNKKSFYGKFALEQKPEHKYRRERCRSPRSAWRLKTLVG